MRSFRRALVAALFLAACSDPPSPSATASLPPPQTEPASHAPPVEPWLWADVAGDPLLTGAWSFTALDGGYVVAAYGEGASAPAFSLSCDRAAHAVSVTRDNALEPDQPTTITIILPAGRLDFAAQSYNEGAPQIRAEIHAPDPRLETMAAAADFAVEAGGAVIRLPGDPMLTRVLAACA